MNNEGKERSDRTIKISLPYGKSSLSFKIPKNQLADILTPKKMNALSNLKESLKNALANPISSPGLTEISRDSKNVCIVVSDSTRPTPTKLIVEAILHSLEDAGVREEKIKLMVATGLHRACTSEELVERLGAEILRRVEVYQHDAYNKKNLEDIGSTSLGTPIYLNREVKDSDLIIGDGYIEPHFFAGYTGGGKNILPGVVGLETIKVNHGASMIEHPMTRAGILEGNPIYQDILEGARKADYHFSINVTLNHEKGVSGIFAGDFEKAHYKGSICLSNQVKVETKKVDVAITTNGGYPLDRDLYQAVKGMAVAETVLNKGGVVIIVSECRDGIGHPYFEKLVTESEKPSEIIEKIMDPNNFTVDQWQAQILARILEKHRIICVTRGVDFEKLKSMHLIQAKNVQSAIIKAREIIGNTPEITVIPGGPSTIPVTR
jgi:nickel-dependent lactate racemase